MTADSPMPAVVEGQVWRSARTWWRIDDANPGRVIVEGPRGCVRTSLDGGATWSELKTVMTMAGFLAWIRKSEATCDE